MKITLRLAFLISSFFPIIANSQAGCTDLQANNYSPSATSNDGSCTYDVTTESYAAKGPMYTFSHESSGLVYTNGVLWTHDDSGNPNYIFKVDTNNGALLQTVTIAGFSNVDWEDIAADSNYIYVGDCGNNDGNRKDLKILKIDKSQFLTNTSAAVTATAQAINFSYSDQTSYASNSSTNFDCESVVSIGNFLYLFTKDRGDFQTRVYKLSKTPGTYTISPYTSYNVNGKITGADYNKQKNEVALIGYMASDKNSFIWFLNDFTGDMFFSGNKRRIEIGNSVNDWQTEGITYVNNNELFLSCESSFTPATLYSTYKSSAVPVGIPEYQKNTNLVKIYPNPSSDFFEIQTTDEIQIVEIVTLDGSIIFSKAIGQNHFTLKRDDFNNNTGSCFLLKLIISGQPVFRKLFLNPDSR